MLGRGKAEFIGYLGYAAGRILEQVDRPMDPAFHRERPPETGQRPDGSQIRPVDWSWSALFRFSQYPTAGRPTPDFQRDATPALQ